MSKHTPFATEDVPLPWKAVFHEFEDDNDDFPPEEPQLWLHDANGTPFQEVEQMIDDTWPSQAARARLWAAAPELLEAAIHLLASLDHHMPERQDSPMRQMARAAIAKATGGTPAEPVQQPLADPMHQLASPDKPLTIGETLPATFAPTVLSQIMRERHAAKTCGWGCPECQAEEQ